MKLARGLFVALLLCACAGLAAAAGAPAAGEPAPAFSLAGQKDKVELAALRGKVVYLDFWASWCGPCKQSFPWMNQMQAKYGAAGLRIVAVNLDKKAEDAQRFLALAPANFTLAFDAAGSTPKRYGVMGMPTSVLIDAEGKVIYTHIGFRDEEKAELEKHIAAALKM